MQPSTLVVEQSSSLNIGNTHGDNKITVINADQRFRVDLQSKKEDFETTESHYGS